MRIGLICLAVLIATPLPAMAEEAPTAEASPAPKIRKICRETPPRTGSNRPGKRVCRTAEEWKAYDHADADFDGTARKSRSAADE
jgi:hypothetical protein